MRKKIEEQTKREKIQTAEAEELKTKIASLSAELQSHEQSARSQSHETSKFKSMNDQLIEQLDGMQRDKRRQTEEIENLNNQVMDAQSRVTDAERRLKSSEADRQQIQDELDDQKDALQAEVTKGQALTQQIEKLKLEHDRKLAEKDDELDAVKVAHRRQMETAQSASDENDSKNKQELTATRKKLGAELEDALSQLELYKKQKSDSDISLKKLQLASKETSDQLVEEQNAHDVSKDMLTAAEKKCKWRRICLFFFPVLLLVQIGFT